MVNDGDEELFIDIDGSPDDIDSADVMLVLALEDMTRVELLAEFVGMTDAEEVPEAVIFKELVGSPEEGKPLDEVFLDTVGSPDEAGMVWDPVDELFIEVVGYSVRAVTLNEITSGIVPEKLLVGLVGTPDGANVVESPVCELLEDSVGNVDAAVDDMVIILDGLELLEECVGIPDEAEAVLLRQPSASSFGGGSALTHLETDELVEGLDVTLTLELKVGLVALFKDVEMLPVGLLVEFVEFVTGNPLISLALMVKVSVNGFRLSFLSLKKQFGWSSLFGKYDAAQQSFWEKARLS